MTATWWVQATPGTTYWRCTVPARHLPGQTKNLLMSSYRLDEDGEPELVGQEGASIWQFPGNATRALIMAELQLQDIRVLMEVDDNYLRPAPPIPNWKSNWQTKLDHSPEDKYSHQAHRRIARFVDAVIVATDELANQYEQATRAPIYVCPNSADLDDWPALREKGQFSIGWAASDSHFSDVPLVERALERVSHRCQVWKLGLKVAQFTFPHRISPWLDSLETYREKLQVLHVGICPLSRSAWHDCKSDIKAIEYALAGALPIVQGDSPAYRDWVDVVPSAVTKKDWERTLVWAVEHPDEVREQAEKARQFVLDRKLIGQHIDKWRDAL